MLVNARKDKKLDKKIRFLRFTPYEIGLHNYEDYLVENNSLHNLLVSIFLLTDLWINSINQYISSLTDSFHRLVEFITRFNIFRNFVIGIQENLGFAFQQYDELYEDVFGSGKPKYRFWRSAMGKWILKFHQFHQELHAVYFSTLTKRRMDTALTFLDKMEAQEPETYS